MLPGTGSPGDIFPKLQVPALCTWSGHDNAVEEDLRQHFSAAGPAKRSISITPWASYKYQLEIKLKG